MDSIGDFLVSIKTGIEQAIEKLPRLDFGLLHGNGGTNAQTGSAPNNVMTLLSNGNVGIGKTNPGEKLEVSGKVKANEFCVGNICLTSDDISKIKNL